MKFIVFALVLVSFFAFVYSLCTPDQWEGIQEETTDYMLNPKSGLLEVYKSVHYDYKNKRSALQMSVSQGFNVALYNILTIYKDGKGVEYTKRIYPFKPCVKKNLTKPFEEKCVPDGSTPIGGFFLGELGVFQVNSYEALSEELTTRFTISEIKDATMIPVMESVKGKLGKYDIFQTIVFKNITAGIKTEDVFRIPPDCKEGKTDQSLFDEDELPSREHFILAV